MRVIALPGTRALPPGGEGVSDPGRTAGDEPEQA